MNNLIYTILDMIEESETGEMTEDAVVFALIARGISEADARDALNDTPGYW